MGRKRKNGEGTVRLRGDGRWEGRVVIGYDEKNLPKTKSVFGKTKAKCIDKLKKLKEQLGPTKSEKIHPGMPFGDWMDFWYQNYSKPKLRATTRSGYEGRIYGHIIPELGKMPLNKLTQNDLQQFYSRLKKERAAHPCRSLWRGAVRPHGACLSRQLQDSAGEGQERGTY